VTKIPQPRLSCPFQLSAKKHEIINTKIDPFVQKIFEDAHVDSTEEITVADFMYNLTRTRSTEITITERYNKYVKTQN